MLNWSKPTTSQYCTWKAELEEYDFIVQHRAGDKHTNADAMSRRPNCEQCEIFHEEPKKRRNVKLLDCHNVTISKNDDDPVTTVINLMKKEKLNDDNPTEVKFGTLECRKLWKRRNQLRIRGDNLYMIESNETDYVHIPHVFERDALIRNTHSALGHMGARKCSEYLRRMYYWPTLELDIKLVTANCIICSKHKRKYAMPAKLGSLAVGRTFQRIAMDIMGPLPETREGYRYVLGIIDHFSRYCVLVALKSTSAESVAHAVFSRWINYFGVPETIHSDNGTNFTSDLFKQLCMILQCKQTFSTPYHPEGDSVVERLFGTVKPMLAMLQEERDCSDWSKLLPVVELAIHTCNNTTTGFTPSEVLFGGNLNTVISASSTIKEHHFNNAAEYIVSLQSAIKHIHRHIRSIGKQQQKYSAPRFQPGDMVLVRLSPLVKQFSSLYKVVRYLGQHSYVLEDRNGGTIKRNEKFMKPYRGNNSQPAVSTTTSVHTNTTKIPPRPRSRNHTVRKEYNLRSRGNIQQ